MPTETIAPPVAESPATPAAPKFGLDSIRQQIAAAPENAPSPVPVVPEAKTPPASPEAKKPVADTPTTPPVELADDVAEFEKTLTKPASKTRFAEMAAKRADALLAEKLKTIRQITPEHDQEVTTLKENNLKLEATLRQLDVERSPEFIERFVERPKIIREALSDIAKTYDIPEVELFNAISGGKASRGKLNEILESVGTIDRSDAASKILELQKIESDRSVVTKDAEASLKALTEKRQNDSKAYVEKLLTDRRTALTSDTIPILEKELEEIGLFSGDESASEKAEIMSSIAKYNDIDLERLSPKDRAAMIASAFISKPLFAANKVKDARIAELEERLSKYDSATPKLGGPASPKTPTEILKSFIQRGRAGEL